MRRKARCAYSSTHPGPWAPSLEERIIGKVHELDRALQSAAPSASQR